jgi:hypothetical protein
MVAGGTSATSSIGVTNIVEIIDLETTKSNCPNFPTLPHLGYALAGSFVDNDHPIVCGGNYDPIGFDM